jgi:hypothetical protein
MNISLQLDWGFHANLHVLLANISPIQIRVCYA